MTGGGGRCAAGGGGSPLRGGGAGDEDSVEGEGAFGADEEGVDVEALDGGGVRGGEAGEAGEGGGEGVKVRARRAPGRPAAYAVDK